MRCARSLFVTLAAVLAPAALAAQQPAALTVRDGWARPQADTSRPSGGYVRIENSGSDTVVITGAECAAARRTEVHEMVTMNDMMRMQRVPALAVAPGATVAMRPGGMHVMLMGLIAPLAAGASVDCTFTLRNGSPVPFTLAVRAP